MAALLRRQGIGDRTGDLDAGSPRVLLVTSAYHMPRATALFEREGLHVAPFPVDFRQNAARRFSLLGVLPSGRALVETEIALRELYGRVVYRVGW